MLNQIADRMPRLGMTDIYHEAVERRGSIAKLYLLAFGTPHLGSFANGIYLQRLLRRRKYFSILDAGCGDGTFSFYTARRLPHSKVLGVDIGEQGLHGEGDTIDIGRRLLSRLGLRNLRLRKLDLRKLTESNTFDLVYSFDVLEHIAENRLVMQNIFRALQPGGDFLLRIPTRKQKRILARRFTAEHEKWALIEHVGQNYEMPTLLADLKSIGFEIREASYTMGFWGRLSFELAEAARHLKLPEPLIFAAMPILKALRYFDTVAHVKDGDGLLVLCRKPKS